MYQKKCLSRQNYACEEEKGFNRKKGDDTKKGELYILTRKKNVWL